jgi:hypothetical protein
MSKYIKILPGQSIFDLALQHYGAAEGVNALIKDNSFLNFEDTPTPGMMVYIGTPISVPTVEYFTRNSINIATASVTSFTLPPSVPAPTYNITIHNSDDSYSEEVSKNLNEHELPDIVLEFNGSFLNTFPSAKDIDIEVVNESLTPIGNKVGNRIMVYDVEATINSMPIFDYEASTPIAILVKNQDGTNTGSWTGAHWEIVEPRQLNWELNFFDTDDVVAVVCTSSNEGTLTSGSGSNVGTITISLDGVTYFGMSFPFTPVAGDTYYFKRSTATVTGNYSMIGTYV